MSTTVAPEAVAPTPAPTPAVAAPAPVERNFSQMLMKVAAQTTVAADPPPVQQAVAIVRNQPPKADAQPSRDLPPGTQPPPTVAGASDATGTPAADSAAATAAEGEAPATADGTATAPAPEPTGEITIEEDGITLRAERNADGTFKTKLDPTQKLDLEFKDKQTGEIRKYTKTLPEVLRLAKDGVALQAKIQEYTPEIQFYREKAPVWERQFTDMQQQLDDMAALNTELLTADEHVVVQRRDEFAKRNSPQARLERLEQEKQAREAAERQTSTRREVAERARSFIQTRLSSALQTAKDAGLDGDAVAGKIALATTPLTVNGVVPPENWHKVEQYINGPFKDWVTSEAARKRAADEAASLARKQTEDAQRRAQQVVNDAGRAMAPIGKAAPDAPAALPKPKNTQEAMHRLINRPLPTTV